METKTYKRLPYGNSNFESIRTENYAYVDKTQFIEQLEQENNKNLFFTRPRKFGKSLFFSMLSHYYDIKGADKFEQLFGDLYIGKHPTPKKNSYVVLKFNFSGLDTNSEESFRLSFSGKIQQAILTLLEDHSAFIPDTDQYIRECKETFSIAERMNVTYRAASSINRKVFVIIDEYDHFANDLIAMGTESGDDTYRKIIRANGVVRDFYETLKQGSETVVDRILLTGITPIMLDDLTSGFNIANNLSLDPIYNEALGFTRTEVDWLMEVTGVDKSKINVDIEFLYNGYLFHKNGKNRVYNPSMMLYFCDKFLKGSENMEYLIDENLKTDYGRLRNLVSREQNSAQLLQITQENGITSDIILKFSIDELHENKSFVSLLFYMGLLTIDRMEEGKLWLKIPNYSIRTIYWEYILRLTHDRNKEILIDQSRQMITMSDLAYKGDVKQFLDYISENIISRLSNRDLEKFDEKYLKIILLNSLFQSRLFIPITEMEVTQGYTDIWLKRGHLFPDIPCEWVWEIKYIKKSDAKKIQVARDESRAQLEKYRNSHLFAGRTDVRYLSLIFIGKDKYEIKEL
ncbi:MAG: hypothetical protein EZS26_002357 [Candidatus Ordinivivax streblomastigis]|uniref:AAA-ATPase-like domain-containing protein n=1 Tax=Candidatus Ordinivivax streblomastigis TaxID=2540710 RepID=A0A5M8NZA4_9BACT|nr:MAG: hypothetical protein EZS26_002357 [Candidatus Ordinivivax streblomastigis]